MSEENNIFYIVRSITLNAHSYKRIDEELLFSSFEKAIKYINENKWGRSNKEDNQYLKLMK